MSSQTSWDKDTKTAVVHLVKPVPADEKLEADLRQLPRVRRVALSDDRQVLTVVTRSRQDCNVVENLLRERGHLEATRWRQTGTTP